VALITKTLHVTGIQTWSTGRIQAHPGRHTPGGRR